ncbi:hypothetical protein J8B03_23360 [Vibrio parahaemolyticus]|uniref:hypothetical protein n=1 Tax=Vibrio parahaemolyticus TaxID=670 RepID=UPI00389265B1|nr:hypothetical protein [Vibrio parahaemolyticus]
MDSKEARLLNFARKYHERFERFRAIEFECVQAGMYDYSDGAFRLLSDMEKCYSSKAYYAALVLAFSAIEIYLTDTEKLKGKSIQVLQKAGIAEEVDWLRKLRNDIVHGNSNELIAYDTFDPNNDIESELEQMCLRAFVLVHELPFKMQGIGKFA